MYGECTDFRVKWENRIDNSRPLSPLTCTRVCWFEKKSNSYLVNPIEELFPLSVKVKTKSLEEATEGQNYSFGLCTLAADRDYLRNVHNLNCIGATAYETGQHMANPTANPR